MDAALRNPNVRLVGVLTPSDSFKAVMLNRPSGNVTRAACQGLGARTRIHGTRLSGYALFHCQITYAPHVYGGESFTGSYWTRPWSKSAVCVSNVSQGTCPPPLPLHPLPGDPRSCLKAAPSNVACIAQVADVAAGKPISARPASPAPSGPPTPAPGLAGRNREVCTTPALLDDERYDPVEAASGRPSALVLMYLGRPMGALELARYAHEAVRPRNGGDVFRHRLHSPGWGRSRRSDLRADDPSGRRDPHGRWPAVPRNRRRPVRGGGRVALRRAPAGRGGVVLGE
jgi:hypothetical protein